MNTMQFYLLKARGGSRVDYLRFFVYTGLLVRELLRITLSHSNTGLILLIARNVLCYLHFTFYFLYG